MHPAKPEFNNPINAIYTKEDWANFKFETKDGLVSDHPNNTRSELQRKEINPKDAQITKIQVFHNQSYIYGFKFYSKDGVFLEAGYFLNMVMKEVVLEEGERLIGVRSKLGDNSPENNTLHCNMILMIGKLA